MSHNPRPTPRPAPTAGPDPEATIESLLIAGLDSYFAGDYERAIHTWTRVLFLDRSHARARAYIERARAVVAESQRELDELLQGGIDAFNEGDPDRARQMLTSAVGRGGGEDVALAVLQRLDRLGMSAQAPWRPAAPPAEPGATAVPPEAPASSGANRVLAISTLCLLLAAAALAFGWDHFDAWRAPAPPVLSVSPPPATVVTVPRSADLLVDRARALFGRGHLHEALDVLSRVRLEDPLRAEADRLRAEIQRALIATADGGDIPDGPPVPARVLRP
jgi:hypothetical protein